MLQRVLQFITHFFFVNLCANALQFKLMYNLGNPIKDYAGTHSRKRKNDTLFKNQESQKPYLISRHIPI